MVDTSGLTLHTNCNLCESDNSKRITVQNSYTIVGCRRCGFVYVNPRPDVNTLSDLYCDYLSNKMADPFAWRGYMENVFTWTACMLEQRLPSKGRVLDIGCGYGFFVEKVCQRGWRGGGIDISKAAVLSARERGLDVECRTIEETAALGETFDAITMFYVLEHLPDPLATLKLVKNMLRPGGVLVLRLPHTTPIVKLLDSFRIKNNLYDPPFHLCDFSPNTIRKMLAKTEYSDIKTYIGGKPLPDSIFPLAVSCTFSSIAEFLFTISGGRLLFPGVSKTTVAVRAA